jgi:hypothetical protein
MYRYSEKIEDTRRRPAAVRELIDQAPETSQASARSRVNRKVLSLEAAGQLRVPESSRRPSDRAIAVCRINRPPRFCTGHWLYGEGVHSNDLRHSEVQCRVPHLSIVTAVFSSRDTRPSNADPHIWSQLERLIQGRLPTGLQTVQNKIAARAGN